MRGGMTGSHPEVRISSGIRSRLDLHVSKSEGLVAEDHAAEIVFERNRITRTASKTNLALMERTPPRLLDDVRFLIARIAQWLQDRKSTRLNSSHSQISYAVFCLKKKTKKI